MHDLTVQVEAELGGVSLSVLQAVKSAFGGNGKPTIEDYMSEIVDHASLAQRRALRGATAATVVVGGTEFSKDNLLDALKDIKNAIELIIGKGDGTKSIDAHRRFVRAIHLTLQAGKSASSYEAVDYFTLNYDTLLEDALSLEKLVYSDGFHGGTTAWWSPNSFDSPGLAAKLFKLHGSIDWSLCDGDVFPSRIRHGLKVPDRSEQVLIWPAATKYREAQRDPYAQLVSRFRKAIRPSDGTQTVLCICGYSFGDEHINVEIERGMAESGNKLTLIAFISDDHPAGQLAKWVGTAGLSDRIRVYANRGFFHGSNQLTSDTDLPWWRFESLTALLGGAR